ncbi:MAG: FliO/MopB family protein [Alphaproteobacteria bacterium]|nr:FliO/MopB family protein [Alphaproteobacteria bacterium]
MSEHVHWTQYLLALVVLAGLLGLLGLFSLAVQRGWLMQNLTGLTAFRTTQDRRVKVTETLVLDPRRRLVIVRLDDEEHVILLGAERETVLKTGPARLDPTIAPMDTATAETNALEEGKAS